MKKTWRRSISGWLAESFLLSKGRKLYDQNKLNWEIPLSKMDKLVCGGYVILRDYADGLFPPTFADQAKAYLAEINYSSSIPGQTKEDMEAWEIRKPFWGATALNKYMGGLIRLERVLEDVGLPRGAKVLELGCGSGWMAEFLSSSGYRVTGTTIAPSEIALAQRRVAALAAKNIGEKPEFLVSPMESVDQVVAPHSFSAVFVFEALHHAFDWRAAIQASFRCLQPGGWLIIANEPNWFHTFISYRVSKLVNTHEIGMSRRHLVQAMKNCGFKEVKILAPRWNNLVSPHWIAAKK